MKLFAVFAVLILGLVGLSNADICAGDRNAPRNTVGLQNFPDIRAMLAGGST